MKLKSLKKKKGFTLVELLVGFAIFGIICMALVGFISMSTRSYRRTSAHINLQIEYQIVMAILNEYVIDCDDEITFNTDNNTLTIRNQTPVETHVFRFDEAGGNLFLVIDGADAPVSRNITAFDVSLAGNNLLAVRMAFAATDRSGRIYDATQLIALRNSPRVIIGTEDGEGDDDEEDDE
jgi:prepilin-type N-terminal cleavage/methylation domain-containing protein